MFLNNPHINMNLIGERKDDYCVNSFVFILDLNFNMDLFFVFIFNLRFNIDMIKLKN
jgi:hypothetical protein